MKNNYLNVVIIGRPNVGKSTLFNRIIQKRLSITSSIKGTTRDRLFHEGEWLQRKFFLIDTGGYSNEEMDFQLEINHQIEIALTQADLVIFIVENSDVVNDEDIVIARKLYKIKKPVILVVNKSDNKELVENINVYHELGFQKLIPISSIHGIGISNLLDEIVAFVDKHEKQTFSDSSNLTKIGIVGKPNVGKSTLVNKILKDERVIVSEIPGTTRDAIDTFVKINKNDYILTDTAGIKKNKKSLDDIEWYAELRAKIMIHSSDIIILVLDATTDISHIDTRIMGAIKDELKPTIVVFNKSDLIDEDRRKELKEELLGDFKFASWILFTFISAKNGKGLKNLFSQIKIIEQNRKIDVTKSILNTFLSDIQMIKQPPRSNGKEVRLTYITFSNKGFPHFIIFSNRPKEIHFSYKRFIENQLRNSLDLKGVPIRISFKGKQ